VDDIQSDFGQTWDRCGSGLPVAAVETRTRGRNPVQ
jgi:hypothetical protein